MTQLIDRAARRWPDSEALVFGAERATFAELAERTLTVARALAALGVGRSEKVGVLMGNRIDYLAILYGAARLGAVAVPVNGRLKADELAYVLVHADLRVLVTCDEQTDLVDYGRLLGEALPGLELQDPAALALECAPQLRQVVMRGVAQRAGFLSWESFLAGAAAVAPEEIWAAQERIEGDETAMMLYTSGTTARPKGCPLSHRSLVHMGFTFGRERFPMSHGDRMWDPLPLFHLATLLPLNGCLAVGASFIGMSRFELDESLLLLEQERCTTAFAAFELIWLAIVRNERFDANALKRLRLVNVNGVPERLREMQAKTPWLTLISPYGSTEGGGVIAMSHLEDPLERRVASAGRPFAGMEARIVDPATGSVLAAGQRGEIAFRGAGMFDGYYKDPDATATAVDAAGWFHSGDLGSTDAEGRLSYLGRLKDMLKVGGENVAAAEVEEFLGAHPAIAAVQVVAAPDLRYTEVPCAFVQLRAGAQLTIEGLIDHCRGKIATYKIPRYLRLVEEWPMSGTKIQKFRLREQIAAELAEAGIEQAPRIGSTRPIAG